MNVDRSPNDSFLNSSFADRISNEQIPHLTVSKPRKVVAPIKNSSPTIPSQPKSIDFSTLSVLVSTVQANEKDVLYFAISLVYRDDPAHIVYTDTKRFSELEATTKSLRALHMKSNLPRVTDRNHNPSGSSYTSAASEELRISLQKFFDVATLDPNVSKNPDLISITGLKTLLEKVKTGAVTLDHGGTILTVPNQSFSTVSHDRDGDFALDGDSTGLSLRSSLKKPTERTPNRRVSGLKESFSPQSTHSSPSPTPLSGLSTPNAAYLTATFGGASKLPQNIRKQFIECYNLLDTEHACAVGIDTLQSFVCSFPHEPASEEVLELYKEIDREHTGTIDPAGFLWIIERLLASSQTKPEDVIHNFHRSVCTDLFHLMGDRISIGDFTDIIENISNAYAIPFDEIYSNIRSTWEERRTARISGLNDSNVDTFLAGSTSNSPTARRHGSMRHGRSSMTLGHPPHPQQQIISSMEQLIKDMSTESQEYQTAIHALRRELTEKEEQIKSLQQELTEAQAAIKSEQSNSEALQNEFDIREKEKDETIDRLLHRIDILQEDLEEEMGKEPENVIEELANTYLLVMPSDLSERTETLLIERPGALLYQLDPPRRPLKLTMDVCARVQPGSSGEYIVCRDSAGHRALAVTIHNCFLTIGVEDSTHSLPQEKWFHLTFKFYWDKHVTDCSINDQTIWSIPFRDRFANEISSLDIFPREVVTVVYRNIRFLL